MIKEAIVKLAAKQNLDYETAEASMDEIMGGKASPVQMSAFLTAMAMKGETIEEITACAAGMRKHCVRLATDQDVLEIVGTGGDHSNSFNISYNVFSGDLGSRRSGGKTRQPCSIQQERCGGRFRSTWCKDHHRSGKRAQKCSKNRSVLPVCTELPPVDEICRTGQKKAGYPYDFQYSWTADQSGRCKHGADGCL